MNIDIYIQLFKDHCNNLDHEEMDGIAEWLEELKAMRNLDKTNFSDGYEKGRQDVIDEIEEKLNNTGAEIIFNLPVEEILGEDIDLDDFAMLVQDAVQVYRKMVLGVLKQLKEKNNDD